MNMIIGACSLTVQAIQGGGTVVRGIRATKWTACIYDYNRNMTVNANLYFSGQSVEE